jgi:hypothetical protein
MRIGSVGLLILVGAAAATAAPQSASAQIVQPRDYGAVAARSPFLPDSRPPGPSAGAEVRDLKDRIAAARESGDLSPREARRLEREARLIGRLAVRYGRDGLSASERGEIGTRAAALRAAVNRPRR